MNNSAAAHKNPFFREIEKPSHIEASGFFDPENPDNPDAQAPIILEQTHKEGLERFRLKAPIGYWDKCVGGIIIPHDPSLFFTDLTSVPQILTWLVPRTGLHLPAVLIHDALIPEPNGTQTYVASEEIERVEADRILRDAMKDLGTPLGTRWLIWAAVSAATKMVGAKSYSEHISDEITHNKNKGFLANKTSAFAAVHSLWGFLAVIMVTLAVAILGTVATLEITDCLELMPGTAKQPMMVELGVGMAAAFIIPTFLAVLWGAQWKAGVIAGVTMSLLLHVMAALVVVFGIFKCADCLSAGHFGRAARWLGISTSVAGTVIAIVYFACS